MSENCELPSHLMAEYSSVGKELGDNEPEETQHGNTPIPSLGFGCERPEIASIRGLSAHDRHQRCVSEHLHSR